MKTLIAVLLLLATVVMGQTFEERLKEKMKDNRAKFEEAYNLKDSTIWNVKGITISPVRDYDPFIHSFLDLWDEYEKKCYALLKTQGEYVYDNELVQTYNLPTFIGFIDFLKRKRGE